MNPHKHQLYLFKQHSESFNIWSAIIRINTECKSLIMTLGPGIIYLTLKTVVSVHLNTSTYIIELCLC